jgi:hypothetical protein
MEFLLVQIGGGRESVEELIAGLPGVHRVTENRGNNAYLVMTNDSGFLKYAIDHQGYGKVLTEELSG